ncbi:hypothetical protein JOM56_014859 [Amanita muscaria]
MSGSKFLCIVKLLFLLVSGLLALSVGVAARISGKGQNKCGWVQPYRSPRTVFHLALDGVIASMISIDLVQVNGCPVST